MNRIASAAFGLCVIGAIFTADLVRKALLSANEFSQGITAHIAALVEASLLKLCRLRLFARISLQRCCGRLRRLDYTCSRHLNFKRLVYRYALLSTANIRCFTLLGMPLKRFSMRGVLFYRKHHQELGHNNAETPCYFSYR